MGNSRPAKMKASPAFLQRRQYFRHVQHTLTRPCISPTKIEFLDVTEGMYKHIT